MVFFVHGNDFQVRSGGGVAVAIDYEHIWCRSIAVKGQLCVYVGGGFSVEGGNL